MATTSIHTGLRTSLHTGHSHLATDTNNAYIATATAEDSCDVAWLDTSRTWFGLYVATVLIIAWFDTSRGCLLRL